MTGWECVPKPYDMICLRRPFQGPQGAALSPGVFTLAPLARESLT